MTNVTSYTDTNISDTVTVVAQNGTNVYTTNLTSDTVSNVTSRTTAPWEQEFSSPPLEMKEIAFIPIYSLIFLLSVVGNMLVIITLIQNKRMRTVTNVFLLNLAVSDLLLAVFCMPFTIIPIMLKNFIFGHVMCVMIRYLQGVSVCVSCFTLVALSLERYFAICRPLHSRKWQTLSHSYRTLAVCWTFAFVLSIPMAVFTKYRLLPKGNYMCREIWEDEGWHTTYTLVLDGILLVLPIIIMLVSYGKISHNLWTGMKMDKQELEAQNGNGYRRDDVSLSAVSTDGFGRTVVPSEAEDLKARKASTKLRFDVRGVRQTNSEKSKVAKKRVIKMLFAVVLEFFICWTPLFVLRTWMDIDINHAQKYVSQFLLSTMFLLSYVSSCCNPITYCFMNRNFRNGFISAFRCCVCKRSLRDRHHVPNYTFHSSARTNMSQCSYYDKVVTDSDEM